MRSLSAGLLFLSVCALPGQSQEPLARPLRWIPLPAAPVAVHGLPWFAENEGGWMRLPAARRESFRPPVWNLAQSPSGARLRFRTNATTLALRLEYPSPPDMANMHAFGQTGVDLYLDGVYRSTAIAPKDAAPAKTVESVLFQMAASQPRAEREVTLYLPLYKPVKVLALGLDADAELKPPAPFAIPRPVVFYGTSITQGGCASRPGMSYEAILARRLNIDFVNLGFSGNGLGEPALAQTAASVDAALYVLDFSQNNREAEAVRKVYAPFLKTLREARPDVPVLCITPIASALEAFRASELDAMRDVIRQAVADRYAQGDRKVHIIEGTDLLGPNRLDGLVDGVHPNDLGFQWMAEGLAPRIERLLGLAR